MDTIIQQTEGRRNKRGKASGRMARLEKRSQRKIQTTSYKFIRKIPSYDLLDEEALDKLEKHSEWILKEIGVEFLDDEESIALFRQAGADVTGTRIRFDEGLIKSLCQHAPSQFTMHGRDSSNDIEIGGNHVVMSPAYGPPFVTDMVNGRRYATLNDFENFVKLTYLTPYLQHNGGTVCEPVDIPVNKRHLDMVYAHLRYSNKPFMGAVTAPERAEDSIQMARIVFGDDYLNHHHVIQGNININSPLTFDNTMTGALKAYVRANQPVLISPFILGGAMSPVTQPAIITQAHAETLVGIALSQLIRKGAPVIYGNFLTTMDLKTGAPTFGTPEANLATLAIGQLARRMGLPLRCGGHLTSSKVADGQAMQESINTMLMGIFTGANFILQSAGWLESGLSIGYEKFIMDTDHIAMLQPFLAGLTLDDNQLGTEAFRQAGPGQNFFGIPHTFNNFETANYISPLTDNQSFEQWQEKGSKDTIKRAYDISQDMLRDYQAPPIDEAVDEALQEFMTKKKTSMDDMWY